MKTYNLKGREVYIQATERSPINWRNGCGTGLPYKSAPYFVRYVDTNEIAIDGRFCCVATAKESIENANKHN